MSEEDKRKGKIIPVTENSDGDQFPIGLRVLAIDANSVCLNYLVALLKMCRYKGWFLSSFIFWNFFLFLFCLQFIVYPIIANIISFGYYLKESLV